MKAISIIICSILFLSGSTQAQSNLKKIIRNKGNEIPANWVALLQEKGAWEFQKKVAVKRNKVRDSYMGESGELWDFGKTMTTISPYHLKVDKVEYSDFETSYYGSSHFIVMSTRVAYGKNDRIQKTVYQVINLTDDYLILEEIKNTYCFDFAEGRMLSKKECKEKASKEPKRMFGGKSITIGKAAKIRMVFKRR